MTTPVVELEMKLDAPGIDQNELNDLSQRLREEIEALDVDTVEPIQKGPTPKGAMPIEWVLVGEWAIKLAPVVVPAVVQVALAWLKRQEIATKDIDFQITVGYKDFVFDLKRSTSQQEAQNFAEQVQQDKSESE